MAQTLTLARIASPFSNDRTYEPMVLHALKAHFSNGHQIVKKGDQICTAIDTNALRRCTDTSANTDEVSDGPEQLHYRSV
jgi:peroxin-6